MKKLTIICECGSPEHQLIFMCDKEYDQLYTEVHLHNYRGFLKRIWIAIKYIFGYKSKYGNFDTVLIHPDDRKKLVEFIQQ